MGEKVTGYVYECSGDHKCVCFDSSYPHNATAKISFYLPKGFELKVAPISLDCIRRYIVNVESDMVYEAMIRNGVLSLHTWQDNAVIHWGYVEHNDFYRSELACEI